MRPSPTPDRRKVDPDTPDGARRIAIAWTGFVGAGLVALGLSWGGWAVAQAGGYEDNFRGFEAGDRFPWIFVILSAAFSVFALFRAIGKWSRYAKIRRQSR
ncbi:hypothetical protein [Phytoactinopolyspora halotolerans]|uniref:Uncharacterized protein n=1 Tax=Phytoactinopolyspora halotolerans TaxID=1981512 RepID=A0A6L9SD88_9ACTN|nr:hypothetical protein [Phytoactinopolyspora halotolerans]NEE01980.1 hypothetical protein [Phytoactinopolyspora halotolerans]